MWRCYQLSRAFFWNHLDQLSKFLFEPCSRTVDCWELVYRACLAQKAKWYLGNFRLWIDRSLLLRRFVFRSLAFRARLYHAMWIDNDLLQIRKMNRAELILKIACSSAITLAAICILNTRFARRLARCLLPPSFERTFSSRERRLGWVRGRIDRIKICWVPPHPPPLLGCYVSMTLGPAHKCCFKDFEFSRIVRSSDLGCTRQLKLKLPAKYGELCSAWVKIIL